MRFRIAAILVTVVSTSAFLYLEDRYSTNDSATEGPVIKQGPGERQLNSSSSLAGADGEKDASVGKKTDGIPKLATDSASGQLTFAGVVAAWSSAPQTNKSGLPVNNALPVKLDPSLSELNRPRKSAPTPEQILMQARTHAKASIRILELQAQQDPANAAAYLAQAAQLAARNEPLLPTRRSETKEATDYQRKLNAFMSEKIDQLATERKNKLQLLTPAAGASQNIPRRAGDSAGPRAGDSTGPRLGDIAAN